MDESEMMGKTTNGMIKYGVRVTLAVAIIAFSIILLVFVTEGFGILGIVTFLMLIGIVILYIQNRQMKKMLIEINEKLEKK